MTGQDSKKVGKTRQRINTLLIGEPGNAKSALLREGVELVPKSRYESGTHSSGLSLTALINKEDESYVLRAGPVVTFP